MLVESELAIQFTRIKPAPLLLYPSQIVISWECRKQDSLALSSTEAGYKGLNEDARECVHLRDLLNGLVEGIKEGICLSNFVSELIDEKNIPVIFNDNQSVQMLSKKSRFRKRTKHVELNIILSEKLWRKIK
jgi:hypothetical protein